MTGDGEIRARVDSVQYTSSNAKGGVMIRETLAATSRHALVDVEPAAGNEFIWRSTTGGQAVSSIAYNLYAPYWVRLTRTNNVFQAFMSPDGVYWTQLGSATNINMAPTVYAGLAVCARIAAESCALACSTTFTSRPFSPTSPRRWPRWRTRSSTWGRPWPSPPPPRRRVSATAADVQPAQRAGRRDAQPTQQYQRPVQLATRGHRRQHHQPGRVDGDGQRLPRPERHAAVHDHGESSVAARHAVRRLEQRPSDLLVTNSIVGPDYAVQVSSNLANWSTLFITNSPPTRIFQWTDTNAATAPAQFYRIKVGPPLP